MMDVEYRFKRTPMPHQIKEFLHHISLKNSGTFSETGSGKTLSILAATEFRFINKLIKSCLYVAPNSILEKIECEIKLDTNLRPLILQASTRKRRIKLIHLEADIYIINYEALFHYEELLKKKKFDCVIADEAHRIKDYKCQAAKSIRNISKNAKYKIAATGTPLGKGPEDIFGIFKFLDETIFGKYIGKFRDKWCNRVTIEFVKNGRNVRFEETRGIKQNLNHEFLDTYGRLVIRHLKEQCINLPQKVYEEHRIDINPKLKKVYKELKDTGIIHIPGKVSAQLVENSAIVAMKAAQVCSGFVYYKDEENGIRKAVSLDGAHKLNELRSILEDRKNKKTVVWCKYAYSINLILKEFKHLNPQIQTSDVERKKMKLADNHSNTTSRNIFQTDPNCHLIINQLNISDGYELTASDCAIYYELPYQYISFKQSQDRIHRKGSEKHEQVMYYYLVTRGTVEMSILNGLKLKKNLSDIVTGDRLKEVLEGNYGG